MHSHRKFENAALRQFMGLLQRSPIQNAGFKKRGLSAQHGSVRLMLAVLKGKQG